MMGEYEKDDKKVEFLWRDYDENEQESPEGREQYLEREYNKCRAMVEKSVGFRGWDEE